jgi:hypothetical protein
VFPSGLCQRVVLYAVIDTVEEATGFIIRVEVKIDISCFAKTLAAVYQATFYHVFAVYLTTVVLTQGT